MQLTLNWLVTLLFSAIVAAESSFEEVHNADHIITNGYPAPVGSVPYIVGLHLREGYAARWCGGSIIANTWVLTAAHCTDYIDNVTITYGAYQRTSPLFAITVDVSDCIQHPNWPQNMGYDIALIRTPYVDFWSLVDKVELPSFEERDNSFENNVAVTCGWGRTYDGSGLPEWLQCADLPIISNKRCAQSYDNLLDSSLCVNTPEGRSICDGDSGGPLVTRDNPKLVGVTSFSDMSSCLSPVPAGFTRITAHLEWIRNVSGVHY